MRAGAITIVTGCTSRKAKLGAKPIRLRIRSGSDVQTLATTWVASLNEGQPTTAVNAYYKGRAFTSALETATGLNAELYVVSAGLGLVPHHQLIHPYDLTIASGHASILRHLKSAKASPRTWWSQLSKALGTPNPIRDLVRNSSQRTTILCLGSTYIDMVSDDLNSLSDPDLKTLRIITSELGRSSLSDRLLGCAIPYDDRLESTFIPGTQADFPQRALRHFIQRLGGHRLSLDAARKAVTRSLSQHPKPTKHKRRRISDAEVRRLLKKHWDAHNGSSSKLLRFLRDDAGVACEQRRFRDIWRQLENDHGA